MNTKAFSANTHKMQSDLVIVDIDVHVHELPEELAEYSEMPWKKALLAIKDVPERYLDIPGLSPGAGDGAFPAFPGGRTLRFVKFPPQLRKELNGFGIHKAILFPDHLLKLALFPDPEYSMALARAYNRWLINKWLVKDKGFYGALCIAPQNPKQSAQEIKELGQKGKIACVYLPAAGVEPLYGHEWYDPVYEAAEKANLPVVLHSVTVVHPVFPFQLEQFSTAMARHAIAHPFAMAANVIDMINTGVPVRFPKLKVCFAEGAIAWVPWVMMRLDKEYIESRRSVPFLEERPSHYIRKFHFGTQPIEEPVIPSDYVKLLELIGGEDNVVYASDWPHHDFDHPRKILSLPIPEKAKKKIMGGNALEFFKIPRL